MNTVSRTALLVAAPASGQGKTAITAGLARALLQQGKKVAVFKLGPDYLDPQILAAACQQPVYQLDLWMLGQAACQQLLHRGAEKADVVLIESAMGMFDGTPCAADFAKTFNLPILLIIDASKMAQTFAAIAMGLTRFDHELNIYGIAANRVASPRHRQLITQDLPSSIPLLAILDRNADLILPSRHLGLVQAEEITDLDSRLNKLAQQIDGSGLLNHWPPPSVSFVPLAAQSEPPLLLRGQTIAIARDRAFSFIYPQNIELLQLMGAKIEYFSPLSNPH
ncbi:MAG: cobyrinate a,c-diamide synthase, partial [Gammaproteobacteria bacterium]